jgi:hypothetical protein
MVACLMEWAVVCLGGCQVALAADCPVVEVPVVIWAPDRVQASHKEEVQDPKVGDPVWTRKADSMA